jgi:hypothetical protein
MTTRMTSKTVMFRRPFVLTGFERIGLAGSYVVDTEEEQIEGVSISAWRRVATVIRVPHAGATEYVTIDNADLDEALARDAESEETPAALQARLDSANRRAKISAMLHKGF